MLLTSFSLSLLYYHISFLPCAMFLLLFPDVHPRLWFLTLSYFVCLFSVIFQIPVFSFVFIHWPSLSFFPCSIFSWFQPTLFPVLYSYANFDLKFNSFWFYYCLFMSSHCSIPTCLLSCLPPLVARCCRSTSPQVCTNSALSVGSWPFAYFSSLPLSISVSGRESRRLER